MTDVPTFTPIKVHPRFTEAVLSLFPGAVLRPCPEQNVIVTVDNPDDGPTLMMWELPSDPPSNAQVEAMLGQLDYDAVAARRRIAYIAESDPLFVRWQKLVALDNADAPQAKADWLSKVAEIEGTFPYPVEA